MTTLTKVNVMDVIGHVVESEISVNGYYGKVNLNLTGRIIYSDYNASLFFKPKGSKNKGYIIESEEDILNVKVTRKDKENHEYYKKVYENKEQSEIRLSQRLQKEEEARQEQNKRRQEEIAENKRRKEEKEKQFIEEARSLGNYEELEKEVITFYQSFDEFFNENFVKNTYIPILNKLINKAVSSVEEFPKYYFDKKHNPKFTNLIETKLNIKLGNTQKGNVDKLNQYLAS
jgi:flagellar biosynthesis GTPase FlhF